MKALEYARNMSPEEVIEKAASCGLKEFGAYNTPVADTWKQVISAKSKKSGMEVETGEETSVAAGLNNCDTIHALWELAEKQPEAVMEGMAIAAYAVGASEKRLYVPEGKVTGSITAAAEKYGVEVIEGIVNKKENEGGAIHHIETMLAVTEIFAGTYEPGAWIAVAQDGKVGELTKVSFGTRLADIPGVTTEEMKAAAIGTKVRPVSALEEILSGDEQPADGVITLYPETCCMICEAEKVLRRARKQSCGKCVFCREGLIQLHTMEEEITKGQGKKEFTGMLTEIGEAMVFSTPCSMGQTGSDFVLGTLEYFADEYEDHIKKKKCKNNVCSAFMSIYIDPNACGGCEECADVCPVDAIEGKAGYIHMIDEFECTKCGKCIAACDNDAIIQTSGRLPKLPTRLTKVGKFKKR